MDISKPAIDQVLDKLFGKNGDQTLTVRNLCYTAFMKAKAANNEDGGPTDWFNDTLPTVEDGIAKLRQLLVEELGALNRNHPASVDMAQPSGEVWPVRPAALERGLFEVAMPDGTWVPVMALTDEHARRLAAYDWSEKGEEVSLVAAE